MRFRRLGTQGLSSQDGIVSLATAVIVGILLSLITVNMMGLMVGELRQASNADQSVKAYFAAEAGVEDALATIKAAIKAGDLGLINPTNPPGCINTAEVELGEGIAYTCQTIKKENNQLEGALFQDEAVQIEPGRGVTGMDIFWHKEDVDPDLDDIDWPGAFGKDYPSGDQWEHAAVMEINAYSHTGSVTPAAPKTGGVKIQGAVLNPGPTGGGAGGTSLQDGGPSFNPGVGACGGSTEGYRCLGTIQGLDSNTNYVFRIRPRYAGTNYKIRFQGGNVQNYAVIDVTGRAGNVFRRVQAHVPLKPGTATGLDYVLFSDTNICKDMKVIPSKGTVEGCPAGEPPADDGSDGGDGG